MSTRPIGTGPASGVIGPIGVDSAQKAFSSGLFRRLVPYFRPYKWRALLSVVMMIAVTAAGLAGPALAQVAIDRGILAENEVVLIVAALLFVGAAGVGWAAGYAQTYLANWVGERVLLDIRTDTFRHAMGLELGYHERVPAGHTVSRLTSDIEAVDQLVTDGFSSLVVNGLTFIGVVVILFLYDWQLALMAFAIFPLLAVATVAFRYYSTQAYLRTRERVADVLANLQETIAGIRVVQGFSRQDRSAGVFTRVNDEYREANMQTIRQSSAYFPGVEMLAAIGTALILFFGSRRVLDDDLSIGVMLAFIGYLATFFDPIQSLSQLYGTFQSAMAALEKIFGLLDVRPVLADSPDAIDLPAIEGRIELRGVSFGYGANPPVLHDIDLQIAAGETVALVGHTGAGKSTLAKLIARFYDPTAGSVLIDGHDLRRVRATSLRHQLGIVPQESQLFTGTIADNLRFGRPAATEDDLRQAVAAVGALEFIDALPDGSATEVQERGAGFSAGQRQLLSFARALISDPRLLILDEATSSIDLRTESRIEEALQTLLAGRTAIVIAHRLSTIRRADRIVVLEDGAIVEQGSHDELLATAGVYAGLYGDWESAPEAA